MNAYDTLKAKLQNRDKVVGTTVTMMNNPSLISRFRRPDLDFILFDAEHGRFDTQNAVDCLTVCRLIGLPSFVRAQDSEYHLIAKAVDMGADGVMIPRVERPEQLRTAVDAVRFAPRGRKGCGGFGQFKPGESFDEFQSDRFILPQIESPEGIRRLPELLENFYDDISAVIIGPYDMSVMVGTPMNIDSPEMREAIKKVIDICAKYKKSSGIFCGGAEQAADYRALGMNVLWTGTDTDFLMRGYNAVFDGLGKIK